MILCLPLRKKAAASMELSIVERQAMKDVIGLEVLCRELMGNFYGLAGSIESESKISHLWQFWNKKISPLHKELERELRKYRIAIAGI